VVHSSVMYMPEHPASPISSPAAAVHRSLSTYSSTFTTLRSPQSGRPDVDEVGALRLEIFAPYPYRDHIRTAKLMLTWVHSSEKVYQ
jgi:hypothetical protein